MAAHTCTANTTETDTHLVTYSIGGENVPSHRGRSEELIVGSGRLESDYIDLGWQSSRAMSVLIESPSEFNGNAKIQVSEDASTWYDLQSGGSDIAITVLEGVKLNPCNAHYVRVLTSTVQDFERTFLVVVHAAEQAERVQ